MWPFNVSEQLEKRVSLLEMRAETSKKILNMYENVYDDVFTGKTFRKIEDSVKAFAEDYHTKQKALLAEKIREVVSSISDVELRMTNLASELDVVKTFDKDIESIRKENEAIRKYNDELQTKIDAYKKDINYYRFEETGFSDYLGKHNDETIKEPGVDEDTPNEVIEEELHTAFYKAQQRRNSGHGKLISDLKLDEKPKPSVDTCTDEGLFSSLLDDHKKWANDVVTSISNSPSNSEGSYNMVDKKQELDSFIQDIVDHTLDDDLDGLMEVVRGILDKYSIEPELTKKYMADLEAAITINEDEKRPSIKEIIERIYKIIDSYIPTEHVTLAKSTVNEIIEQVIMQANM